MKKILYLFYCALAAATVQAQEPADALRYSWVTPGGTARQQAIGGAMGSLGGDVSATFVNPAGLAFYKTGDFVFSSRLMFGKNTATYRDRTEKQQFNKTNWGTTGFATPVVGSRSGRNVALSFAYNRNADFNSSVLYRGTTNQSSYSLRYLEELDNAGVRDSTAAYAYPFGPSLAINTYWIDPVKNENGQVTGFKTNSPIGTGLLQENRSNTTGGVDEFALGVGAEVSPKLLLGATVALPILRYTKASTFTEADASNNSGNGFNFASIEENLSTRGAGLNAKLGLIFKPVDYLRLGFAFHTPTVYSLRDLYEVTVTTDAENNLGTLSDYSTDYTDGQPSEFSYLLFTPYRAIASASYVLREVADVSQQRGFITADLEYVNYRTASFKAEDPTTVSDVDLDYLDNLNVAIDNAYKSTVNIKLGGEVKFTTLMVRAGAAYYGNPYKNINGEKGRRINLSGGLGYRNNGFFVDLAYVRALTRDVQFAYRLQNTAYDGARIRSGVSNVQATVGIKF